MDEDGSPSLLRYRDSWRYGGYSTACYRIDEKEISEFDPEKYEEKLKQTRTTVLQRRIAQKKSELLEAKADLENFLKLIT